MNNGSRYRKSNYRKKRIKTIVIISLIAFVVLFVVFMSIGLSLAEKTKAPELSDFDDLDADSSNSENKKEVAEVQAYPLPLLEDGSSFASRLSSVPDGATAVCVSLNTPDGTLNYRSSLASSLSYLSVASDASSLSTYMNAIGGDDLYSTATLYVNSFKNKEDDLMADVELSIWGSIACEAIRGGVSDVLLIANGAEEEDVDKLCSLAERIHITEESAIVGLALPSAIISAEKSEALISTLSKAFDYLAFDVTDIELSTADSDEEDDGEEKKASEEKSITENIESAIADMQLRLMYYKMRVLLPRPANDAELSALTGAVTRHSINSWQILPH